MSSRTQPRKATPARQSGSAAQRRTLAAQQRAAAERRAAVRRARIRWAGALAAAAVVVAGVIVFATRGADSPGSSAASGSTAAAPRVGGDLHTVFALGTALYVGGHDAVAVSHNGGRTYTTVPSLAGADAMGWAATGRTVLVGGHPGLYRSTNDGASFNRVTGSSAVPDVHALGGAGKTLYLGSPQAGVLASTDGGANWQVRNAQAGRSFMGTILVDPQDPSRLIAPDMSAGLTVSSDGGRTWTPFGGPMGAMAATWNPTDSRQILAVGMNGGQLSTDGGASWHRVAVPSNTTAVGFDATGRTLYAGALDGQSARIYRSSDNGTTWTPTA